MTRYSFKMEKVLEFRRNEEKTKAEDFIKTNVILLREQEYLNDLKVEYDRKSENVANNVNEMKMQFLYGEKLKEQLQTQERKIDEISIKLEDAKENLIEARKNRQIIEKLKERDKEKFYAELYYQEQKELDDISVMKYAK